MERLCGNYYSLSSKSGPICPLPNDPEIVWRMNKAQLWESLSDLLIIIALRNFWMIINRDSTTISIYAIRTRQSNIINLMRNDE